MKVLMITGDKNTMIYHSAAWKRIELQRSQVEKLDVLFWGRGAILSAFIVRGTYDVVTVQDPFWRGVVAWLTARRLGATFNVQVHADLAGQSFAKRTIARFVLHRANSVRVVSKKGEEWVRSLGVTAPVRVLPIFVDVEKFRGLAHVAHAQFKKVILWIGRFEKEKNPLKALEVLKEVREGGVEAGLVYLGSGQVERALRTGTKEAGLEKWVEFAGWHSDILPYLAQADVVLSTSVHESWGASIVEALAAGVPVVACDVGVVRDAGATVAPIEKLGEKVIEVLRSGQKGVLALPLLSREEYAQAFVKILQP